jgi:hypothetical protein
MCRKIFDCRVPMLTDLPIEPNPKLSRIAILMRELRCLSLPFSCSTACSIASSVVCVHRSSRALLSPGESATLRWHGCSHQNMRLQSAHP